MNLLFIIFLSILITFIIVSLVVATISLLFSTWEYYYTKYKYYKTMERIKFKIKEEDEQLKKNEITMNLIGIYCVLIIIGINLCVYLVIGY